MISRLYLRNFKAFENQTINLRPITLILGPNNSGKSSILAALRLLVQTLESRDPDVPLLLNGVMGDLGTYKDIVYMNHRGRVLELGVTAIENRRPMRSDPTNENTPTYYWDLSKNSEVELNLTYKFRVKRRELILNSSEVKKRNQILLRMKYSDDSGRNILEVLLGRSVPTAYRSSLSKYLRMRNFIPQIPVFIESEKVINEILGKQQVFIKSINPAVRSVSRALESVDYIGAMRVPPSRLYPYSGERRKRIGAAGENSANILAMDNARGNRKSPRIAKSVSEWLSKASIASSFMVSPASDSFYEIKVRHPETNELENLADVGLGNSQILPILVGGYNLASGSTYLVEEPEIHLHPKAQAELGSFFLELYERGVQSIIETHSEHLIIRLQQYVAERKISPDDIQFLFVCAQNGRKVVKSLELDEDGFFVQEWPGGFFPERLEEAKKLARIRSSNMTQ